MTIAQRELFHFQIALWLVIAKTETYCRKEDFMEFNANLNVNQMIDQFSSHQHEKENEKKKTEESFIKVYTSMLPERALHIGKLFSNGNAWIEEYEDPDIEIIGLNDNMVWFQGHEMKLFQFKGSEPRQMRVDPMLYDVAKEYFNKPCARSLPPLSRQA